MRLFTVLTCTFLGTLTASAATITAATITGFTITPVPGSPFSATLNSSFTGSAAKITNTTVSCVGPSACSGALLGFGIVGTGSGLTPFFVNMDGNLSGTTDATGAIIVGGVSNPFSAHGCLVVGPSCLSLGDFSLSILSTSLPISGSTFNIAGTLSLSLAAGQTLSLPSSLSFSVAASPVPEPGTCAMLVGGLLGAGLLKRRRVRV